MASSDSSSEEEFDDGSQVADAGSGVGTFIQLENWEWETEWMPKRSTDDEWGSWREVR